MADTFQNVFTDFQEFLRSFVFIFYIILHYSTLYIRTLCLSSFKQWLMSYILSPHIRTSNKDKIYSMNQSAKMSQTEINSIRQKHRAIITAFIIHTIIECKWTPQRGEPSYGRPNKDMISTCCYMQITGQKYPTFHYMHVELRYCLPVISYRLPCSFAIPGVDSRYTTAHIFM